VLGLQLARFADFALFAVAQLKVLIFSSLALLPVPGIIYANNNRLMWF
jgi:hypothetical protein